MPEIEKPKLLRLGLVALGLVVSSQILYASPLRMLVFFGGVFWAAGAGFFFYICHQHTAYKSALKAMDDAYRQLRVRAVMIEPLTRRYGPEQTMQILQLGEELVNDGDFPDIRAAVASIERHHDYEPLTYDDE